MSLNGIMSDALSALRTNTTALDVVSSNISNINTPGYAQRVVNEQAQAVGGQLGGVEIADIERVTNQFFTQATLSAQSSSSLYSAQNNILSQINALLGQVGSGTDLPSQLDDVFNALGTASLSPTTGTSQQAVLTALNKFASSVSSLSSSITNVQNQADQQVQTDVGTVNGYIQQIYQLNQEIEGAQASGDTASDLLDQRDQVVQSLSKLVGVSTTTQSNGMMLVSTTDGVNLVGNSTYAQLACAGGASNGTYAPVTMQSINALTGLPIGASQSINPDLGSGEIAGLMQMRDGTLGDLQQQLGTFAQQAALSFNAQYNANASFPPPTSLTGRDTGLLAGDSLNFTGDTTFAVTDPNGNLVSRIDVDFDTGTLSVDGGASVGIGTTVGSFVSALNSALGANGSASFNNGQLSIDATGGNGIVIQDDASNPSSRGGTPLLAILRHERRVPVGGAFDLGDGPFGVGCRRLLRRHDQSPAHQPQRTAGTDGERHAECGHDHRKHRHRAQHGVRQRGDLLAVRERFAHHDARRQLCRLFARRDEQLDAARHDGDEPQRTVRARRPADGQSGGELLRQSRRSPTDSNSSPSRSRRSRRPRLRATPSSRRAMRAGFWRCRT